MICKLRTIVDGFFEREDLENKTDGIRVIFRNTDIFPFFFYLDVVKGLVY